MKIWRSIILHSVAVSALIILNEFLPATANFGAVRLMVHTLIILTLLALVWAVVRHADHRAHVIEERFRALAESVNAVFWILDAETNNVLYISPAVKRLTGYDADTIIGKPLNWKAVIHPDDRALFAKVMERKRIGERAENTYRILRADGSMIWLWDRVSYTRDARGKVRSVYGVTDDITPMKEAEQHKLELAVEREKVKMWEGILRDASHDLRTPLTTIRTSVYLLNRQTELLSHVVNNTPEGPCRRKAQDTLDDMHETINRLGSSSSRLERMVDGLLDMIRLENSASYQFQYADLNQVVEIAIQLNQDEALEKSITLNFERDDAIAAMRLDTTEMCRAVAQLLGNAVRYTPDGGQILVATHHDSTETRIEVTDNGPGIDSASLPHIFEYFYRADGARTTSQGGMGLGLPIAQTIVTAHGGTIEVQSTVGKGSKFTIRLPLPSDASQQTSA